MTKTTDLQALIAWQNLAMRIPEWANWLPAQLAAQTHGDLPAWLATVAGLPDIDVHTSDLEGCVTLSSAPCAPDATGLAQLEQRLRALHPWRKGPFNLFGIQVDTEWHSDWKWQRVAPHVGSLKGQRILDVGCGNGYFGWQMLSAGADLVVGIDPTLVFVMQHLAINKYLRSAANWVIPARFEETPGALFDTVFSMGVLYHRKDPVEHLQRLAGFTAPGGRVVVETLISETGFTPRDRYARMSNVWHIPSAAQLVQLMTHAGFSDVQIVDITPTTVLEQRSTDWMRFESLSEALDPADPARTVEGYPAPLRATAIASA
ncbi:MAG: tRNA 5-methoxyuridine(34)/uridine 5-oxyacetic acid(34) synthase CmoB [Proteobacteria bacterium]|nr:tRNA 5-methoxyuridine(34)/uridine 5-oxyacetic acid(34) synthase CmoB [Pseudomonadota bacterium]